MSRITMILTNLCFASVSLGVGDEGDCEIDAVKVYCWCAWMGEMKSGCEVEGGEKLDQPDGENLYCDDFSFQVRSEGNFYLVEGWKSRAPFLKCTKVND